MGMTPEQLKAIANAPGYGTGKSARNRLAAEAEIRATLPDPQNMQPIWAASNSHDAPLAHFGNSSDDGNDWGIYWEGRDCQTDCFGDDAKTDAQIVAAIVNGYRLGILRVAI